MKAVNPSTECRKMAELLRETAKAMHLQDTEIRAEYAYLIRSLLRLARQIEQDRVTKVPQARNMHELASKSS
jgi:hypothetical protein